MSLRAGVRERNVMKLKQVREPVKGGGVRHPQHLWDRHA